MVRMGNKKKLKYLFFVFYPDHPNILLNFLCNDPYEMILSCTEPRGLARPNLKLQTDCGIRYTKALKNSLKAIYEID